MVSPGGGQDEDQGGEGALPAVGMDGESREVQVEDVIKTRVEEGALPVTGKVMYYNVELRSVRTIAGFGFISSGWFKDLFSGRVDWRIVKDIFLNGDLVLYEKQCSGKAKIQRG